MAESKQSGRLWLWIGAAVLLIIVFFVTRSFTRERVVVRVARAGRQQLVNNISTNGRVEPVMPYEIHSPLATTVMAVFVQQGDKVAAGKVLLKLDDMQSLARLASAESGVKTAQASLDAARNNGTAQERQASISDIARARADRTQAQHDLDALTKLKAGGAASEAEVYAAKQRLGTADAALHADEQGASTRYAPVDVSRAQASLADAQAGLAAAREVESETEPKAPISGSVYSLKVGRSDFVNQGDVLLEMADVRSLRVRAYFDEPEIGQLAEGEKVQIKWDGDPRSGHTWSGHVVRVPTTVGLYTTRTVGEALIEIDDGGEGLLPDTNVTVTVTTSTLPDALTVPRQALYFEAGKTYVYKVVDDQLVRTPVTVGIPNLTLAPILSGLNEGDVVATGSISGLPLQDGEPIKVAQ
jgi:HlyD family secretion protein